MGVFIGIRFYALMIEAKLHPEFAFISYHDAYNRWAQVSGYFDGDGSVYLNTSSSAVLQFALVWVDNCREQLGQLRWFLMSRGISTGEVLRRGDGVFTLAIASPRNVLKASKLLLRHCYKKKFELGLVIDYYENKINGSQAIDGFNSSVRMGVRVGKIRSMQLPLKYDEAKREIAVRRGRRSQLLRKLRTEKHRT
jgi:hypothetical protein